ncbi:MAG: Coenzyme A biosynthesis bifunctional protein CoaBC [Verrucomicrobia subdivision 3 bacterium]|nr:Coenzyme A biosynthesis bifunctional protein CoaBC [Limisphaerales bacterium]MCS1414559.1 Coenzyme A biosynthesis bifunctional protein CoaBC [Limisphaerales bacterium]
MLKAIVTAGPTHEPLDEVRRLTNHSTGRLGIEFSNFLTRLDIEVTLLIGYCTTYKGAANAKQTIPFTTTESLAHAMESLSRSHYDAVFHAAAVSDYRFEKIYSENSEDPLPPAGTGKISTGSGKLIAELVPTKKILRSLRSLFPDAFLVGWKYEVEGNQETAIEKSILQIRACQTDLSVANGPAYGNGFSIVGSEGATTHANDHESLYKTLTERFLARAG